MMVLLNAQERTLDDFIKLGDAADLEFVKLWDFGEMSAVELKVKTSTLQRTGGTATLPQALL